jgi:hypothetical protein
LSPSETQVTVPLFVMQLVGSSDARPPRIRALDTLLAVSNGNVPGGAVLTLRITFRRGDGSLAEGSGNPANVVSVPGATVLVSAAASLDQ